MTNPNHGSLSRQTKTEGKSKANANQNSQNTNSTPGSTAVAEPPKGDIPQIQLSPEDVQNSPSAIYLEDVSLDDISVDRAETIPDEEMIYRINYSKARQENIDYYLRFNLYNYNLYGGINPAEQPIAYANATWRLQRFLYEQDIDSFILGEKLDIDGALGPYTFYVVGKMARTWAEEQANEAAVIINIPIAGIESLMNASESVIEPALRNALAEIIKPELLFTWQGSAETEAAIDSYASTHHGFDEHSQMLLDQFLFGTSMANSLSDYHRFEVMKRIYAAEPLALTGFAFRVNRDFSYKSMDNKELRNQAGLGEAFGFFTFVTDELKLSINSYLKDTMSPAALNFSEKIGYNHETEVMHGLMVFYHMPPVDTTWVQEELLNYLAEVELEHLITEVAMQQTVAEFEEMKEKRLSETPDVNSMDEFLSVLVYQTGVETSNINKSFGERMHEKARNEFGLVVKLAEEGEATFVMLSQIESAQAQAMRNAERPLKFGIFEDNSRFTGISAIQKDNGTVMVTNSSFDLVDEERSDDENLNNFSVNYSQYFDALEPVIFKTSELNKDDPAIYWLYKNIVNENTWTVNTMWVPAGSLPQITDSYWKQRDFQNWMTALDLGFTIFGIASIGAAGMVAKGTQMWGTSALATEWATYEAAQGVSFVIKKMMIEAVQFGVGEMFGIGLQSLNSYIFDPKNDVSKEFQEEWATTMKFVMIVGLGSGAAFTAFKALRRNSAGFVNSTVMRGFQRLEDEMFQINKSLDNLTPAQKAAAERFSQIADELAELSDSASFESSMGAGRVSARDYRINYRADGIQIRIDVRATKLSSFIDEAITALDSRISQSSSSSEIAKMQRSRNKLLRLRERVADLDLRTRANTITPRLRARLDKKVRSIVKQTEEILDVHSLRTIKSDTIGHLAWPTDDFVQHIAREEWPKALEATHTQYNPNSPPPITVKLVSQKQMLDAYHGQKMPSGVFIAEKNEVWITNGPRMPSDLRNVIAHELFHAAFDQKVVAKMNSGDAILMPPEVLNAIRMNTREIYRPLNEYMAYTHGYTRAAEMTGGEYKAFWLDKLNKVEESYKGSLSMMEEGEAKALLMDVAEIGQTRINALSDLYGVHPNQLIYLMTISFISYNIFQASNGNSDVQ